MCEACNWALRYQSEQSGRGTVGLRKVYYWVTEHRCLCMSGEQTWYGGEQECARVYGV